jgi:hypothetical protein
MQHVSSAAFEKRIDDFLVKAEIDDNIGRPHDGDGDDANGDAGSGAATESKTDGVAEAKVGIDLLKFTAIAQLTTDKEAGAHLLKDVDARKAKMAAAVKAVTTAADAGTAQERKDAAAGGAGGGGGNDDEEEIKATPAKRQKSSVALLAESANKMAAADTKSAEADLKFAEAYAKSTEVSMSDELWYAVEEAKSLHAEGILDDDELEEEKARAKEHFKARRAAQRKL